MRTHPDLHPGSKDAEEQFRELLQAYEVLRNAHARALYDAHLAERRRDTVRRFAHSAAVMVTTFLITTSSAIFVLGQQGISVHSETWQIATAWLTSVEVEPTATATAGQAAGMNAAWPPATVAKAAAAERNRKQETDVAVSPKKSASARKTASAADQRAAASEVGSDPHASGSWPAAAEPFYSLGEWKLK
jgi:hypothetical protein